MPGNFIVKASQQPFLAGESSVVALTALPQGLSKGVLDIKYAYDDLKPVVDAPYLVIFDDGTQQTGTLDDKGEATIVNPPGPGRVFFGYDQREPFAYHLPPENPIFGFRPSSPEDAAQALERYAEAEAAYMADNYFPDEIAAIYSGTSEYDDLTEDYEYAAEVVPEDHDHDDSGMHDEVLVTGNSTDHGDSAA